MARKKGRAGQGTVTKRGPRSWQARGVVTTKGIRKRVSVTGTTEREALNKLKALNERADAGLPVRDPKMRFSK